MSNPEEERPSNMQSVFSGFVLDPEKCSNLSLGEKRELVRQIAQWSKDAPEILSSFTRRELLEIICAEMGKERKYRGYSKHLMIQQLLKVIELNSKSNTNSNTEVAPAKNQTGKKRKGEASFQPLSDPGHVSPVTTKEGNLKTQVCQNVACRATFGSEQSFCKRCSCCICHLFDENKDPSLWLTCGPGTVDENGPCGMSCHLECALKHEKSGIIKSGCYPELDGSFYCVACGKVNDLMRCCVFVPVHAQRYVDSECYMFCCYSYKQRPLNTYRIYQDEYAIY